MILTIMLIASRRLTGSASTMLWRDRTANMCYVWFVHMFVCFNVMLCCCLLLVSCFFISSLHERAANWAIVVVRLAWRGEQMWPCATLSRGGKSSNWEIRARWGFSTVSSPLPNNIWLLERRPPKYTLASSIIPTSRAEVLMNRDSWGRSYQTVRGEMFGLVKDGLLRNHSPRILSLIENES